MDIFVLSEGDDQITDFNIKKDSLGAVYALNLDFTQEGDDLRITGDDNVNTLLLNTDKKDFLANYPNNLEIVPFVEVNVI